jgi:alkanesulfonate monooxygenase SsuD/methylene tetrahydromethanopterin reductase-like flavin-dependent oxidoreductase (luciferase family)
MHVSPKPTRQPRPPIWIGGSSDAALRRTAVFADVWQPTPTPVAELVERRTFLRQACEQIGRPQVPETRMSFRVEYGRNTAADIAANLMRYRQEAGVAAFQINFHGNRDLGQLLDSMDRFVHEVQPLVT